MSGSEHRPFDEWVECSCPILNPFLLFEEMRYFYREIVGVIRAYWSMKSSTFISFFHSAVPQDFVYKGESSACGVRTVCHHYYLSSVKRVPFLQMQWKEGSSPMFCNEPISRLLNIVKRSWEWERHVHSCAYTSKVVSIARTFSLDKYKCFQNPFAGEARCSV